MKAEFNSRYAGSWKAEKISIETDEMVHVKLYFLGGFALRPDGFRLSSVECQQADFDPITVSGIIPLELFEAYRNFDGHLNLPTLSELAKEALA